MIFLERTLLGLVIGVASITPGVSGGAIAAAMGIYEPAVRAISDLRKNLRQNILYLIPLGIGAGVGVLLFSRVVEYLYGRWPCEILYLFFGIVAGSIPSLVRIANEKGFKPRYLWATGIALSVVLLAAFFEGGAPGAQAGLGFGFLEAVFYGMVLALGTIVPGISTSFILMYLGVYDDLLAAIAGMRVITLLPVALGFCAGALPLIRLANLLFKRFRAASYYGVLGFLAGSMIAVFPGLQSGWQLALDLALFAAGTAAGLALVRLDAGKDTPSPAFLRRFRRGRGAPS